MNILYVVSQLDFADHIAISYLSAIAQARNHQNFFCSLDSCDLTEEVSRIKPDVVAFSANVIGFSAIVEAHRKAKRAHPYVSILGGPQATFSPQTFVESGMDAFCRGEGEYAFRDFLDRLERKIPYDDVENLITKRGVNPLRPLIADLDQLPIANRDLILANSYLKDVPKKTFYTTRGCPFCCTYCCNNYYNELYRGKGPIVRRFSVERVIREIEDVKSKYRTEFIKFGDDLFAMKADPWLEEFAEKYARRISIPFNCYLRFDTVDDRLLGLLKKAGCFSSHLSVDSTSKYIREKILKRKMREVDIVAQLRLIRSYGINTWVNYMLAVPESTLQDDLETIRLSKKARVTYPSYSTTVPMEGTELYDYCVKKNIINVQTHRGDMTGCYEKSSLSCFSEREKNARYNIYLLGALISKFPAPLFELALQMIKLVPPNAFFKKIRESLYRYYISHKIFMLPKERPHENM